VNVQASKLQHPKKLQIPNFNSIPTCRDFGSLKLVTGGSYFSRN